MESNTREDSVARRMVQRLCLALLCAVCLYVLSFGPACWIMTRRNASVEPVLFAAFSSFYQPVSVAIIRSPMWSRNAILWYLELGAAHDAVVIRDWPQGIAWNKPGYTYTVLSFAR